MEEVRRGRDSWAQFDDDEKTSNYYNASNTDVEKHNHLAEVEHFSNIDSKNVSPLTTINNNSNNNPFCAWQNISSHNRSNDMESEMDCNGNSTVNNNDNDDDDEDLFWSITTQQKSYYLSQFLRLQSNPFEKLDGSKCKAYFELSKLGPNELAKIWELADQDQDGKLTFGEFSVAVHLVALRVRGIPVPNILPQTLFNLVRSNLLPSNTQTISLPNDNNQVDRNLNNTETDPKLNTNKDLMHHPTAVNSDQASSCGSNVYKSPPPCPPPRIHLNPSHTTDHHTVKGGESLTLRNHYLHEEHVVPLQKNKDTPSGRDQGQAAVLKQDCSQITQTNEHLSQVLMKLQKARITMKLIHERLMPL